MAGIDKSDFHPLGRPQLSSTVEPRLQAAASLHGSDDRIDAASLVRICKANLGKHVPMAGDMG